MSSFVRLVTCNRTAVELLVVFVQRVTANVLSELTDGAFVLRFLLVAYATYEGHDDASSWFE
jgi:hypothetical protein